MRRILSLAFILLLTRHAWAAEIRVVTANPLYEGLVRAAERFKRETGHDVKVQAAGTAELVKMISSADSADILVGTAALVDQAIKDKKTLEVRTPAGRVGIAVVVRRGARVPNVSTADALRQAVLGADAVVYNTAGSGQAVHRMFEQMGIVEQIQVRSTRPSNAPQTMERVLQDKGNVIGFGLLSEIKPWEEKGIEVAGRLPASLQSYTSYEAVIFAGTKVGDAAKDFIRYLTTPAAKTLLAATGVD